MAIKRLHLILHGKIQGVYFRDYAKANMRGMARITVKPEWVGLIDFQTRYPSTH